MGYFRTPNDVPTRYQWDADSKLPLPEPGTAPGNCGMTCVATAGQYYTDDFRGIYHVRRLSTTTDWVMSTTISEQSMSLTKLGVPNVISRPNLEQITKYLSTGHRPLIVGFDMSKVPQDIAGHPFRGHHAILLRANRTRSDGTRGKDAMDPNFNRTYRTDPTKGHRFYPNWVLEAAYYNAGMWAIVPLNDKQVPPPWYGRVRILDGNNRHIRESAKEIPGNTFAISRSDGYTHRPNGDRLWRNAYLYHWDGEIRNGFYVLKTHGGDTKFIRRDIGKVARQP